MRVTELRVDPRPVAAVRIGLGIAAMISALEASAILMRVAEGRLRFPLVAWLPAPTEAAVTAYLAVGLCAGMALAVGYRAAAAAAISASLGVVALVWDQQTYSSHRLLITLVAAYLVVARSDSVWSLWRGRPDQHVRVPWWPQLLVMSQVSACYLFAGLSKINGLYLGGEPFAAWLWLSLPSALLPVIAVGSVLTELFLAVGLWFRATRWVAAAAGVALHLSIVVLMRNDNVVLLAFALASVPSYALFLWRPSLTSEPSSQGPVPAASR